MILGKGIDCSLTVAYMYKAWQKVSGNPLGKTISVEL